MIKNIYLVTDAAPADLRRRANSAGEVAMTAAAAKYELMRGTLRLQPAAVEPAQRPPRRAPLSTPVLPDGGS